MKRGEIKDLRLDQIVVSDQNVRNKRRDAALDDLVLSIKRIGLIEPVVAFPVNGKYELIVGQRRFLAYLELSRENPSKYSKIKALVIDKPTEKEARLMSLVENLQRTDLTASEKTRACTQLLDELGSVRAVSDALGWKPETVTKWLEFGELVPAELKELVDKKQMSRDDAKKLSAATYPNLRKAVELGTLMVGRRLTRPIKERLFEIARSKPGMTVPHAIEEARRPRETLTITFHLVGSYKSGLERAMRDRKESDVSLVAQRIVEDWLDERGYTGK